MGVMVTDKEGIFLSCASILVLFNIIYYSINVQANPFQWGAIWTGLLTAVVTVTILAGIQIMGSGLSDVSIKVLFASAILLVMMFQITIPNINIQVGIGLLTNVLNVFVASELMGIGYIIVASLGILTFISAILIIVGV